MLKSFCDVCEQEFEFSKEWGKMTLHEDGYEKSVDLCGNCCAEIKSVIETIRTRSGKEKLFYDPKDYL